MMCDGELRGEGGGGGGVQKLRKILVYFVEKYYWNPNLQQAVWLKLGLKREARSDMYCT
jgi:hypothetical protein